MKMCFGIDQVKSKNTISLQVKAGESWDEKMASDELARLRSLQSLNRGPSFGSVSASGSHAAMPHYEPTPETNSPINDTAIYKIDSGGQYLGM
jgi:Xaa-Pro aminopeptidase